MIIRTTTHARAGLAGNPSDGYFGKTVSFIIPNYSAEVTLWESPQLEIVPSPTHDPTRFESLGALWRTASRDGYYGGLRLIFATCKKFREYCVQHGIRLPKRNFTITYDTDIPRQVGLGGSSAIVVATLKALFEFYGISEEQIPKPLQPNLALSVETEELHIPAGYQDRVIQFYGGLVHMDFSRELMESRGYGQYESLDPALLPRLLLVYIDDPSESGLIHSDVRSRWQRGDPEVLAAMEQWARYADEARAALLARDYAALGQVMDAGFDLRRRIYGDDCLGRRNLRMIEIARQHGLPAQFPGSGGAAIAICQSDDVFEDVRAVYEREGYRVVWVQLPQADQT
jgi:glucuronokinase